jgi:hypothetical protein
MADIDPQPFQPATSEEIRPSVSAGAAVADLVPVSARRLHRAIMHGEVPADVRETAVASGYDPVNVLALFHLVSAPRSRPIPNPCRLGGP